MRLLSAKLKKIWLQSGGAQQIPGIHNGPVDARQFGQARQDENGGIPRLLA